MAARFRLAHNLPMEKLVVGPRGSPFAPLYDVEELDADGFPIRTIAVGVGAEAARAAIAREGGTEDVSP